MFSLIISLFFEFLIKNNTKPIAFLRLKLLIYECWILEYSHWKYQNKSNNCTKLKMYSLNCSTVTSINPFIHNRTDILKRKCWLYEKYPLDILYAFVFAKWTIFRTYVENFFCMNLAPFFFFRLYTYIYLSDFGLLDHCSTT